MPVKNWSLDETLTLSDEQFHLWQALLEERTGMQFAKHRKIFLETSLARRMREIGLQDFDSYYNKLMAGAAGKVEWVTLVDRLTVQETSFFRHACSFELVRQHCETALEQGKSDLNVWSVGCSTGEEPYSLAMLMNDVLCQKNEFYWGITATDISLPALSKARAGIYSQRKLEGLSDKIRARYFKETNDPKRYQISEQLTQRICFAQLNVLALESAPMKDMDIIYCQNMLIYFQRWRKRDIVTHLAERLAPGGLMVLGVSEILDWSHPEMERVPVADTLAFVRRHC